MWSFSPARHGCGYTPATSSSPESALCSRAALLHCARRTSMTACRPTSRRSCTSAYTSLLPHSFAVRLPTAPCCAVARARAHGCCQHVERACGASRPRGMAADTRPPRPHPPSQPYNHVPRSFTARRTSMTACSQDEHDGVQTNVEATPSTQSTR